MTGDEIWVWQEREPNGNWGTVSALIPTLQLHGPLLARSQGGALGFKHLAEQHALKTGRNVRLAHFTLAGVLKEATDGT